MANGPAAGAPRPDVVVGWPLVAPADLTLVEAGLEGLTNAEIRGRMFVSVGTVKSHLNHFYDKRGVTNRRQPRRRRPAGNVLKQARSPR